MMGMCLERLVSHSDSDMVAGRCGVLHSAAHLIYEVLEGGGSLTPHPCHGGQQGLGLFVERDPLLTEMRLPFEMVVQSHESAEDYRDCQICGDEETPREASALGVRCDLRFCAHAFHPLMGDGVSHYFWTGSTTISPCMSA